KHRTSFVFVVFNPIKTNPAPFLAPEILFLPADRLVAAGGPLRSANRSSPFVSAIFVFSSMIRRHHACSFGSTGVPGATTGSPGIAGIAGVPCAAGLAGTAGAGA